VLPDHLQDPPCWLHRLRVWDTSHPQWG